MKGFRAKPACVAPTALCGHGRVVSKTCLGILALVLASAPAVARQASFLDHPPAEAKPSFSGLATAPDAPSPVVSPDAALYAPVVQAPDPVIKIDIAFLPKVSSESVGVRLQHDLGADMWKGTPRLLAEKWLDMSAVTASATLNDLLRRLLLTPAAPPDGASERSLVALRAQKLVALGDALSAWALVSAADASLVDDATMVTVIDHALIGGSEEICGRLQSLAQARTALDWQKQILLCQLRARDTKAAQVTIDVLRTSPSRDDIFLQVAEKNVLGDSRILPTQLTPLTPSLLGVLRLSGQSLPGQLYGRPPYALTPGLLRAPAKQDVAQLTLAERAAARGVIDATRLGEIYKTVAFKPDSLATPLSSAEAGSRLRALLYQAAQTAEPRVRIALVARFLREAPPELLTGAGGLFAAMLGDILPDALFAPDAMIMARAYMLADKGALALDWYKLARQSKDFSFAANDTLYYAWPQLVLSGLENVTDYATNLDKWTDAALARADTGGSDAKVNREAVTAALLLLDANGFAVSDAQWAKVIAAPTRNEKRYAVPALLVDRMRAAAASGRRAETILAAAAVAGDGDIPLPLAIEISRSLRQAGLKAEAALFARAALYGFGGRAAP